MSAAAHTVSSTIPTLWLRRPERIQQHLEFAAHEIQVCVLSVGGQQVFGRVSAPSEKGGCVHFEAHGRLEGIVIPPQPGAPVRIDYEGESDRYTFFSEIVEVRGALSWTLASPNAIERKDKRQSSRTAVEGEAGFSLHLQVAQQWVSFPMLDLSDGGVAFRFDPQTLPLVPGELLSGTLKIPGHRAIEVTLEVRYVQGPGSSDIVGTRFRQIGYDDRLAVRSLVADRVS